MLETRKLMLFSHVFFQDQRLVGLPSLRLHLPVWRHAHLVSSPQSPPKVSRCQEADVERVLVFVPTGLTASSTKCSGTSLYPTACTKVRSRSCCETCSPPAGTENVSLSAGFVQFLQCYYQSGCLYRLRTLGERHTMDLTVGQKSLMLPQAQKLISVL